MWLAACLWVKRGVEMGVGWGRTPFSERKEHRGEGGFQNTWKFPSLWWAWEKGARLGIPTCECEGVSGCQGVGRSERVRWGERVGGRESKLGAQGGPRPRGAPGSERGG